MSEEEGKSKGGPQQYGTFQGPPNYAQPAIGFPQPVPPPGLTAAHPFPPPQQSGPAYYARGYHAVTGTPSIRLIVNLLGSRCFLYFMPNLLVYENFLSFKDKNFLEYRWIVSLWDVIFEMIVGIYSGGEGLKII